MKEKLIQFYNEHKNDIEYIIIGGSSSLSYINNIHDIDVFVTFKDRDNIDEKKQYLLDFQKELRQLDDRIMIISHFLAVDKHWYDESVFVPKELEARAKLPAYAYLFRYDKFVCGNDNIDKKNIDILNEPTRGRYIESLKRCSLRVKNYYESRKKYSKSIYHLLTGIYILQNNSYDLTKEQIANINLVHDKECTQELYDFVINEINKL